MKKVNEHIEKEVARTLTAFDDIQKASPRPFFYARLNARLQATYYVPENSFISSSLWIRVVISVVVFLIIVNAYTVSTVKKPDSSLALPATNELQSFIGDYYPQTPTVYTVDQQEINQ